MSVIDATSCRTVRCWTCGVTSRVLLLIPWLAVERVSKQMLQVDSFGCRREVVPLPLPPPFFLTSLFYFFLFLLHASGSLLCCFLLLEPTLGDLYAVHGQWVHIAALRGGVGLLRIPLRPGALWWPGVRVGSRRCVVSGCFAKVIGGLIARCGFHWIKWCYHGARISGEHLVRTCIFLIIISGIHRYEFLLSAIERRLYQINPAGKHGPSTKEEQDPNAVQLMRQPGQ